MLALALIAVIAPQKFGLAIYTTSLVSLAAVMAYWFDRALFPYTRPDVYLARHWRLGSTEPTDDADTPSSRGSG